MYGALQAHPQWRVRAVETLSFNRERNCVACRSIQVAPLRHFIEEHVEALRTDKSADFGRIVLPITKAPKRPLFDFDVTVDGNSAYLLPRTSIAHIESMDFSTRFSDGGLSPDLRCLIEAICGFTPGRWQQVRQASPSGRLLSLLLTKSLSSDSFLLDGSILQHPIRIARGRLLKRKLIRYLLEELTATDSQGNCPIQEFTENILRTSLSIGKLLDSALGEALDIDSSASMVALAMPYFANLSDSPTYESITTTLESFAGLVEETRREAGHDSSEKLSLLAEFGRRWQVLVDCIVPLNTPFLAKCKELRPVKFGWRCWTWMDLPFNDARSNHIEVDALDDAVTLRKMSSRNLNNKRSFENLIATRRTDENLALYASGPSADRSRYIRLGIRFSIRPSQWLASLAFEVLNYASILIISLTWSSASVSELTVLVVPMTFASSLVATRDRTSTASRMQRWMRIRLLLGLLAIWTLTAILFLSHHVK